MDVMIDARAKVDPAAFPTEGGGKRLELEMALEIGGSGGRVFPDRLRRAAEIAGAEVVFTLPPLSTASH